MSQHSKLQSDIIKYLNAIGGVGINIITASKSGTHDIVGCIKGKYLSIEVKVSPDKPSDLQIEHGEDVIKAGGIVLYAYSLQDAIACLEMNELV